MVLPYLAFAQETEISGSTTKPSWSFEATANNYIFKGGDYIISPVASADYQWLHIETRYNYEDEQTFSFFGGYNFSTGNKLTLDATPIIGFAAGNSAGIIPGLEFLLAWNDFELYSESEYLIDINSKDNNFFYAWSEINYYPAEWLSVGFTMQRTRLYQSSLEVQSGLAVGLYKSNFSLNTYFMNLFIDEPFYNIALSYSF